MFTVTLNISTDLLEFFVHDILWFDFYVDQFIYLTLC